MNGSFSIALSQSQELLQHSETFGNTQFHLNLTIPYKLVQTPCISEDVDSRFKPVVKNMLNYILSIENYEERYRYNIGMLTIKFIILSNQCSLHSVDEFIGHSDFLKVAQQLQDHPKSDHMTKKYTKSLCMSYLTEGMGSAVNMIKQLNIGKYYWNFTLIYELHKRLSSNICTLTSDNCSAALLI